MQEHPDRPRVIDLNADLGEGFPDDEALLDRISSAGICCGAHAGGRSAGLATIRAALRRGVVIGAHPGFPDRDHFGRLERPATAGEAAAIVGDQLDAFAAWADEAGASVRFVKPHGALYNQAQRDPEIARGILAAIVDRGALPVLGLPGSAMEREARRAGVPFVPEGFADRRYRPDGSLVPRTDPRAIVDDPAESAAQAIALIARGIRTLCLHGDDPGALAKADRLREALARAGILVRSFAVGGPES
jgi:UPF0271 protein